MHPNPLAVQELVDHCLTFVHATPDLRACALVSRSWAHPAQSQLFRERRIVWRSSQDDMRWMRFRRLLGTSPHLIPYIRYLAVAVPHTEVGMLSQICGFPFTHLASIYISIVGEISHYIASTLQKLFRGRSVLRRVKLRGQLRDPHNFMPIWVGTSQTVAPGVRTIEVLDLAATCFAFPFNLSIFPKLTHLRLDFGTALEAADVWGLLQTLAKITPETELRTITINLYESRPSVDVCAGLDIALSTLLLPPSRMPILVLEAFDSEHYAELTAHFPRLRGTDFIRLSLMRDDFFDP
ncbi:hypothetical protein DFH06DRAFT_357066 [Mycena polygramma]|nr:hypothetical protein DFH06DRAFT_357066 [Mycena polygramma]